MGVMVISRLLFCSMTFALLFALFSVISACGDAPEMPKASSSSSTKKSIERDLGDDDDDDSDGQRSKKPKKQKKQKGSGETGSDSGAGSDSASGSGADVASGSEASSEIIDAPLAPAVPTAPDAPSNTPLACDPPTPAQAPILKYIGTAEYDATRPQKAVIGYTIEAKLSSLPEAEGRQEIRRCDDTLPDGVMSSAAFRKACPTSYQVGRYATAQSTVQEGTVGPNGGYLTNLFGGPGGPSLHIIVLAHECRPGADDAAVFILKKIIAPPINDT